jgi:branched-chain amino acid transport system permease protein
MGAVLVLLVIFLPQGISGAFKMLFSRMSGGK